MPIHDDSKLTKNRYALQIEKAQEICPVNRKLGLMVIHWVFFFLQQNMNLQTPSLVVGFFSGNRARNFPYTRHWILISHPGQTCPLVNTSPHTQKGGPIARLGTTQTENRTIFYTRSHRDHSKIEECVYL